MQTKKRCSKCTYNGKSSEKLMVCADCRNKQSCPTCHADLPPGHPVIRDLKARIIKTIEKLEREEKIRSSEGRASSAVAVLGELKKKI